MLDCRVLSRQQDPWQPPYSGWLLEVVLSQKMEGGKQCSRGADMLPERAHVPAICCGGDATRQQETTDLSYFWFERLS